ncbi:Lrp/AsnC family transcriptional regulator [Paludibaculum fermentans]|uniref:Lrp/AsnC family transcriptional regulator n=2 Tax=Paludibaculum fermentans TaxID=1473598 RepID=A0A7S7SKF9_PALFE|nr:Lrp/AsnC family transcriptional regulator [Paludibaculum fermentans]
MESMDARDWELLKLLQEDARMPFAELGRRVKLTPPAVAERVRRMEDQGIIQGYTARINRAAIGRPLRVFLRVQVPPKEYPKFLRIVPLEPCLEECHHVTGAEAFVLKASVRDVAELEQLIQKFSLFGPTVTSIVLSTPMDRPNPQL